MRQRHLEGLLEDLAVGRESGEDGGEGRADVGPESQRVHAVEMQHAHSNERGEGRREDGTALDQHRQSGADEDGHVAGEVTEDSREVGVDEVAQDEGDLSPQYGVEQLDDKHETQTEHEQSQN